MNIPMGKSIVKRLAIRPEDPGSDTYYVDTDNNGELAMDGLFTNEPVLAEPGDIFDKAEEKPGELLLESDFDTIPETNCREEEYEGSGDDQYNTDGDLEEVAYCYCPEEHRDSMTWAINPEVEGKPEEMELLILA